MKTAVLHSRPDPLAATEPEHPHEHAWRTESAHATSEGQVLYVRCAACGARRVDLHPRAGMPPTALSTVVARTRP